MIAILVLGLVTVGWLAIALAPSVGELARPKDDHALPVDMYEADVRSFASGFRRYMSEQLPNLQIVRRLRGGHEGTLPDGTTLLKLVEQASPLVMHGEGLDEDEISDRTTNKLVVSYARMILPRGLASVGGLYATEFVCGGESGVFRALLGERDVVLGRNSMVLRWIHSDANLSVESGSVLHGRASAERRLTLAPDTTFERIYGRPILFGDPVNGGHEMERMPVRAFVPEHVILGSASRLVVDGDLEIPERSLVRGNVIARGALRIGAGSRIEGSVKSHGTLTVESSASIAGSAVSAGDIVLEEGVIVGGPVIAEGDVTMRPGVLVGEYGSPATVTAENVFVSPGAAVFGTVWTRGRGAVHAAAESWVPRREGIDH